MNGTPTNIHRTNIHRTNVHRTNPPQDRPTPGTNPPQGQTYTRDKPTPRQTHPKDKRTPGTNPPKGQTYTRDKPTPRTNLPQGHLFRKPTPFFFFQPFPIHPFFLFFRRFFLKNILISYFRFNPFNFISGYNISFLSKLYNFPNVHIVSTCI